MSVESLILRLSDSSNTQTNIWTTNLRRANTFLDPHMPQVAFSQSLWKVYIHYFSLHSDILILPGKMGIQSVHSDFPCKMASKQEIKPMVANLLNIQVIFFGPSEWTNAYLWKTTSISVAVAFVSSCVTASLQEVDCQHDTSEIEQRKKLVVGQPLQIWRLLRYNVWGASRRKLIITCWRSGGGASPKPYPKSCGCQNWQIWDLKRLQNKQTKRSFSFRWFADPPNHCSLSKSHLEIGAKFV